MADTEKSGPRLNETDMLELVKLFEGFSQASSNFAQSYRALEKQIAQLSSQLEEQVRLLRRTEGFLASVLASVPAGIIVLDMDGNITLFNAYAETLTGYRAGEVIGRPYTDFVVCKTSEPDSALYSLAHGTVIESREKELHLKNGHKAPVRFSTSWYYDEQGEPAGIIEVFEDFRTLKQMEERVLQSANLASLGEMAAQVAHELRNPLAGVQGFTQFLDEDLPQDHPARGTANKIIQGVREIDSIAGRFLEFTNPVHPTFRKIDLKTLLCDQLDLIRAEIENSGTECEFELKLPESYVQVECDEQLIRQAVLNLLKNAVQACSGKGRIEIELRNNLLRNRVWVAVSDTGSGIKEDHLKKIFSPFFTTRIRGTGLGLAMVKKIVDVHGGSIQVESNPDEGSRFELEIPIARLT